MRCAIARMEKRNSSTRPGRDELLAKEADLPGGQKEHPWKVAEKVDDDQGRC